MVRGRCNTQLVDDHEDFSQLPPSAQVHAASRLGKATGVIRLG
jgi:hypothetical protein